MRRVTRGPIVIMSSDPDRVQDFWLNAYAPEVLATEARRYPSAASIAAGLHADLDIVPVPIPLQCSDGLNEAYCGRPEMLLSEGARQANSAWSFVSLESAANPVRMLRADLESGTWDDRYGSLRRAPHYEGSLRLGEARAAL